MVYTGEDRRKHQEVYDPPAESGIKLISIIAALTLLMIGGFGTWIGTNIEQMKRDLSITSAVVGTHEVRIRRNESDIISNKGDINEVSSRVHRLENKLSARQ